jgi:hypothetical protein
LLQTATRTRIKGHGLILRLRTSFLFGWPSIEVTFMFWYVIIEINEKLFKVKSINPLEFVFRICGNPNARFAILNEKKML